MTQNRRNGRKNHSKSVSIAWTCKKLHLAGGQTSKIDDSYTLSAVFSKTHFSPKVINMGAKMEFKMQKILTNL